MTDRCHLVWGRGISDEQRAQVEAWYARGMKGEEPPLFGDQDDRPEGQPMWLLIPGCVSGWDGPEGCTCDTLENQLEGARAQLSESRELAKRLALDNSRWSATLRRYRALKRRLDGERRDQGLPDLLLPGDQAPWRR